ncbi:hypothetical protein POX_h09521 [Penicillium oxalicum]|uniref:Uncharacterized protein n=1 Tax=Penicillium oxalicum (strain 114-2 / CGMCC 5302) TaxID=933388 RepID=S8AXY4_PENO1|nr:hypothetical protein POX_h09521 [Penicillium oxalicum]EPS31223.1 hypothetical protein PDE_06178 [Penicillium oxalicum 114-2]KAI2785762.1 hypothetical protein POX_h09521 [Penicillium oxalicum]
MKCWKRKHNNPARGRQARFGWMPPTAARFGMLTPGLGRAPPRLPSTRNWWRCSTLADARRTGTKMQAPPEMHDVVLGLAYSHDSPGTWLLATSDGLHLPAVQVRAELGTIPTRPPRGSNTPPQQIEKKKMNTRLLGVSSGICCAFGACGACVDGLGSLVSVTRTEIATESRAPSDAISSKLSRHLT